MNGREWYLQQLKKPEWKTKARKIRKRDCCKCVDCGGTSGVTLHVHHEYYVRKKYPWEYPAHALVTLCDECHQKRHDNGKMPVFDDHEEANAWVFFNEFERIQTQEAIDEIHRATSDLLERGAIYDEEGYFYSLTDEEGVEWTFDDMGNVLGRVPPESEVEED